MEVGGDGNQGCADGERGGKACFEDCGIKEVVLFGFIDLKPLVGGGEVCARVSSGAGAGDGEVCGKCRCQSHGV